METAEYPTYEEEHLQFVSSENGTASSEIASVLVSVALLPFLSSLLLPLLLPVKLAARSGHDARLHLFLRALIDFPIVVLLPCFLVTFLSYGLTDSDSDSITTTVTVTLFATGILLLMLNLLLKRPEPGMTCTNLWNKWNQLKNEEIGWNNGNLSLNSFIQMESTENTAGADTKTEKIVKLNQNYPFITNTRGMINYITVLCILAVDFPIFPRRFAKTRKYGVSLMDIGTGSFIFANGVVSPESKNCQPNFKKSIMSTIPLFILGFGRLIAIKGSEYHEVVEEYGVHWNFFFTLAFVKILSTIIFTLFSTQSAFKLCAGLGIIYEAFLLSTDVQEIYLLNPDVSRSSSLINANREGIFSALGYQVIYLASVNIGQRLFIKRRKTVQDWAKYLMDLGGQAILVWSMFYFWHRFGNPSCRRVANLSYGLWVMANVYTIVFVNLLVSLVLTIAQKLGVLHGPMISYYLNLQNLKEKSKGSAQNENVLLPDLTKASLFNEAICFNGLLVFLVCNLLTGLVNYSMITMYSSYLTSAVVLLCYSSVIYAMSFLLYWHGIRLKFW